MNRKFEIVFTVGIFLLACSRTGDLDGMLAEGADVTYDEKNVALLARENDAFALDLFHRLSEDNENVFFSPFSISEALAMTYAGAGADTREQMKKVLRFPLEGIELHGAFYGLHEKLAGKGDSANSKLSIATSIWPQKNYDFKKQYYSFLTKYYGVSITPLDFIHDLNNATRTINNWVSKKTDNRIRQMLEPKTLNGRTRLVIVDAICFKGSWTVPFPKFDTMDRPFYIKPTKKVLIAKMKLKHQFNYARIKNIQMIEFPYIGGKFSMLVILPAEMDGLGEVEKELTNTNLRKWREQMKPKEVLVYMPKFKMTSTFKLANVLRGMGITDAFIEKKADFSGMNGKKDLYISAVIHKAFIKVDEQGTEASASSAILMRKKALKGFREKLTVFDVDRPFIFMVMDNQTGTILFFGRIKDPSGIS